MTFSINADHQDIVLGMHAALNGKGLADSYALCSSDLKVHVSDNSKIWQVNCPEKPGVCKRTFDIITLIKILKRIRKEQFDIIFFETLHVWNLPIMLLKSKRVKTFQMIHDIIPHTGDKQEKSVILMNKAVCRLADNIVICNKKYGNVLTDSYNVELSRIKTYRLWRSFPEYTEPCYSKKILFFGRINAYKGVDKLYEIIKKCPDIQFDVVGRVDINSEQLVEKIKELPNVAVTDRYVTNEELENFFIGCDWTVLPYNSATQSGVIIDAYRYGKPIIAFDVGAISEQVIESKTGFLVSPDDVEGFSEKLRNAAAMNKEDYDSMSKAAYEFGLKNYSVECAAKGFAEMLE